MRSAITNILSLLFFLLLSSCSVINLFTKNDAAESGDLPADSSEVISNNIFINQPIESPVFTNELDPLDSVLILDSYRTLPLADSLLNYAKMFLGKPYVGGGNGPDMFDCSGFTKFVFGHFGYNLFRTSDGQMLNGKPIKRQADLRPGDLVFYSGRKLSNHIGHVGIVIENDPKSNTFTFIHACSRGVSITKSNESYYLPRYISACRVLGENATISTNPNDSTYKAIPQKVNKPKPQSTAKYYTIKKGDTLSKIAQNNHTTVKKICDLNHISRNKTLQIGKKIRIK